MHEARELLHTLAAHDVARALCAQEERLLTELMHAEWPRLAQESPTTSPAPGEQFGESEPPGRFAGFDRLAPPRRDVVPEIPSFLVGPR